MSPYLDTVVFELVFVVVEVEVVDVIAEEEVVEVIKGSVILWVNSPEGGYSQIQWSLDWQLPGCGTFVSVCKEGHIFCHADVDGRESDSFRTQKRSFKSEIFNFCADFSISEYSIEKIGSLWGFAKFPP